MKRTLKIILISILSIITLIIGTGVIIGVFYEKEVTNIILTELNKNIATEIEVKEINFSVFKKFPDASIEFKDVVSLSTTDFKGISAHEDTLFTAKSIILQFNVIDIIKEVYTVKAIHIDDADVRLITNSDGSDNYRFWKSDENSSDNFSLKLKSVKLTKTNLSYTNRIKNIDLITSTKKFMLEGDFTSETYVLNSKGVFNFDKLKVDNVNYATKDNISLNADIKVDDKDLVIENGELRAEDLNFEVNGKANIEDKLQLDLNITGKNIDVKSLLSAIPKTYRKNIDKFNSEGTFYIDGRISGELSNNKSPHLEASFGVKNGSINNTEANLSLKDVFVKGKWTNGDLNSTKTSELIIDSLNARLNNSTVSGSYSMKNFIHPSVKLDLDLDADLNEVFTFLSVDTIENSEGKLKSNISFSGDFNDLNNITNSEISIAKKSGYVSVSNALIKFKNAEKSIEKLNGSFKFNNKNIEIDNLSFVQGKNDVKIEGFLYNLFDYFLVDNKDLRISGTLTSNNLDVDEFLALNKSSSSNSDELDLNMNDYINYRLKFYVKHIKFRLFEGTELKGNYKYYNKTLTLSDFSIKTMDGNIYGDIALKEIDSTLFAMNANTSLSNVNIEKLFYSFDNFGQDFIVKENLKGSITTNSKVSLLMNEKLIIDLKSIIVDADVSITNGELIEFKPLYSLSKFIELSELKDIKFSNLDNNIYINDEKIFIPNMKVTSNAFNIDLEGEHSFAGSYEYSIRILLSDLLSNKARKAKRENTEFGVIEDDNKEKMNLFLIVKGDASGNVDVSYDKGKAKEHISEKYKEEKQNIKQILHEEFGLFKKDTTITKHKKKQEEKPKPKKKKVQVQWDDD